MEERTKKKLTREWIIIALCLGIGAHVTLGLILHGDQDRPIDSYVPYGFLISLSIYVCVQLVRSVWWYVKPERSDESMLE